MDFGAAGLARSIHEIASFESIAHCGAGRDLDEARKPYVLEEQGVKLGVISRCERQFGVATASGAGTAVLDSSVYEDISRLKRQVDHVVLVVHGGAEMIPWPSPTRRADWKTYIDAGATAVVGNHSHVPSAWEFYNKGVIFYGLGNFCVDPDKWDWHPQGLWSLVPEFYFSRAGFELNLDTRIIESDAGALKIRSSNKTELGEHLAIIQAANRCLNDPQLLNAVWQDASMLTYKKHFSSWVGVTGRAILRAFRTFLGKLFIATTHDPTELRRLWQAQELMRYHLFACPAHHDVISTALGVLSGELVDMRTPESKSLVKKWVRYK